MSTPIEQNTLNLKALFELANSLPDAGAADPVLTEETFTENGTYEPESGTDGFSKVTVAVEIPEPELQDKTVTENGTYEADLGYDGLGQVTVNVPVPSGYIKPSGNITITENCANKDIKQYATLTVNVASSGGSLPERITALTTGEYIPSSDITSGEDIEHNLGETPNFFLWFLADDSSVKPTTNAAVYGGIIKRHTEVNGTVKNEMLWFSNGLNASSGFGGTQARLTTTTYLTDATARICTNSTYAVKSGCKYYWICGSIDKVT